MFAFEYNDNHSKHDINNRDDVMECNDINDDDALMIVIDIKNPHRDRIISSECEEMLRELYSEIIVNCHHEGEHDSDHDHNRDHDHDHDNEHDSENSISHLTCDTYDTNDADEISAIKTDYEWNYTMPILTHICGFYGLKKRRTKREIIESIVEYETLPGNEEIVKYRKQIFEFMRLIKENEYMKRFILFP